jgi:hypothetical protein
MFSSTHNKLDVRRKVMGHGTCCMVFPACFDGLHVTSVPAETCCIIARHASLLHISSLLYKHRQCSSETA